MHEPVLEVGAMVAAVVESGSGGSGHGERAELEAEVGPLTVPAAL